MDDLTADRRTGSAGSCRTRLADLHITLSLSTAAKELLVREGYDPIYGARPLRRTVQRMVETPLSRALLSHEFVSGDSVEVDARGRPS